MPTFPVRGLAERGLVLDAPPASLGINAFSNGSNVRFMDDAVRRSSVLRTARSPSTAKLGRGIAGFTQSSGYDRMIIALSDGRLWEINEDSSATSRTPAGFGFVADERPWTFDMLGDVLYANRPTHVPVYFTGTAATFLALPGWDSTHRARAIAASRDQLFAVNIVKGVTALPNTVKISDYALYGAPPTTWDPLAAGVANEVTLAGARTPLVGCLDLDGTMIVYAERQAWRFVFTGDTQDSAQNLWVNEPLFLDRGLIAPNAAAYYGRKHYVFGADDLYVHDGVSVVSAADNKVRRWVFRYLDSAKADRCFTAVDPNTDEVIFAFASKDADAAYAADIGCNRGAVLSLRTGLWTLIDLPDCTSAGHSNFNPTTIWSTVPGAWSELGGSWADLADGYARTLMLFSPRYVPQRILAVDEAAYGRVSFPATTDANPTAFAERTGIDLDELGVGLSTYKIISTVFPQVSILTSQNTARFRVGAAMYPQGPYTWGAWQTFDPTSNDRIDFNSGGRYLGIRMEMVNPVDFVWTGMDVDLKSGGRRPG